MIQTQQVLVGLPVISIINLRNS